MNTLKTGSAKNTASNPAALDLLGDRAANSCAPLVIACEGEEQSARSIETSPGLQVRAKPQSCGGAIKVREKIFLSIWATLSAFWLRVTTYGSNRTSFPISC